MFRSELYDGLSDIVRDQIAKEVTSITKHVSFFELDIYKSYMIGKEKEILLNKLLNDEIKYTVYERIGSFLDGWLYNLARKRLELN